MVHIARDRDYGPCITQMKLRSDGKKKAADMLSDFASCSRSTKNLADPSDPVIPATADEAAFFISECDLSERQYKMIRLFCKDRNANIFPSYDNALVAKKKSYPSNIEASEDGEVRVPLQDLLDHTTIGILEAQSDVLMSLSDENLQHLTLYSKWGCDGSSGFTKHKQAKQDSNNLRTDSSVFYTALAPLQLSCPVENQPECIVWRNSSPASPQCCRPLHLQNKRETSELTLKEVSDVEAEISQLKPTEAVIQGRKVIVTHHLQCSMVDGKVVATVLEKSMQCCNVCGLNPKRMNSLEIAVEMPVNRAALRFGLSPLHALLRFFALVISLSTHIPLKKSRTHGKEESKIVEERKKEIQRKFHSEMNLLVDVVQSGGVGTSTTGNTARTAFDQYEKTAEITGVECSLLKRFSVILQTIRTGFAVNIEAFDNYAKDTARLYVEHYSWYFMPSSVHKVLIHGAEIMAASPLPLGMLTEECQEASNGKIKRYKSFRSYRGSEKSSSLHVFQRLMLSSDPRIFASSQKRRKRTAKPLSQDVLVLLQSPDAIFTYSSSAWENVVAEA